MRLSSLFGHAIEVYGEFRSNPAIPADAIMRRFFHDRKYLGAKDRRFIADVFFGTIKNWRRLEALVEDCFEDREISPARTIVAYASAFLEQPPEERLQTFADVKGAEDLSKEILECLL